MHPAVSILADNVVKYHHLLAPLLYTVLAAVANVHTPVQHSLLITTISWLIVWVPTVFWVGIYSNSDSAKRKTSWLAGALLGLSVICDRAACDKQGIWATKALIPFFTVLFSENQLVAKHLALPTWTVLDGPAAETKTSPERQPHTEPYGILAVLVVSASAVLGVYAVPTTVALGVSSAIFAATGLVLFESTIQAATEEGEGGKRGLGSANGNMTKGHPAAQLIDAAEADFQGTLNRQSKSLADAVREYRRRNGISPPPHFDKWYEFATRNGVVMIDEYDTINEMLLPFWALKPSTIRSRIANALGHEDSSMLAIAIRHGAVENFQGGDEWQQQATIGMMKQFVQYLPDMDLGFNLHDEPRVVVPDNLLSSMVAKARDEILPRTAKNTAPRNAFSARPEDLSDGTRFAEVSTTKFNRFAHQQTWTHSRLSCSPGTQAQTFEDYAADNFTAYAASDLGFIYNTTAFSDICNSPSFSSTFGFFERPNAFSIIHELTPVFSQSKISSFQDILYPSPWYWMGKVGYDETHDTTWENKTNSLYWRGSTTGGFSRNGGWRRQHRQHVVQRLNAPDTAKVLEPVSNPTSTYAVTSIERKALKDLIDVHFSHIGQCDPGDCDAQNEFFDVTERVDGQDAWYYKHLLDMDGNAFSGRFYSFLKSRSLTYKMALFREWHAEWLRPWVHYIPLSLRGDEHLDLVRWFSGTQVFDDDGDGVVERVKADGSKKGGNGASEGEKKARLIAKRSSEWHDSVLRNVDFEVWFFRLLLEYGRVVDDKREEIGFAGP
ncbi:uncharacterized protein J4E84_006704 [Alternaria hordeiaustralica]|uniref:uncharacterized protein n=1 Tax=Alternaria hordeiaustralica TaxID=1187925 RepID=UPI0020C22F2F|nr:uncharacterized protein J4E84_006704 [Alternaria hordeiaustralica]KAI4683864.1 hypothetical protein J4E84_006704 [Alternaria hordeiaustralica]